MFLVALKRSEQPFGDIAGVKELARGKIFVGKAESIAGVFRKDQYLNHPACCTETYRSGAD